MKRYPVFRALYQPIRAGGVPTMLLVLEIAFAVLFIIAGYYLAVVPILFVHIAVAVVLKQDPFIVSILMDISSMKDEKRRSK